VSLRLLVLSVGSPRQPGVAETIREYEARLDSYFAYESIEVQPKRSGRREPTRAMTEEAELLLRRLPDEFETFALTRTGRALRSRELAATLEEIATYGRTGAAFVIGGAFGLDASVVERCRYRLSLSALTLPHDLARLVLTEQLYRAGTLLRGEPYHKSG